MEGRQLIEELLPKVSPNASIVAIEEREADYAVTIAGTTGVVARCEVPRAEVAAAGRWGEARRRVASMLKRCADDVVAEVPDGRG